MYSLVSVKPKSEFHNSKLELIKKDPDEWILNLKGLQIRMSKYEVKGNITDDDFIIYVLNNFPKEYYVILKELESHHTLSRDF